MKFLIFVLIFLVVVSQAADPRKCSSVITTREGLSNLARSLVNKTIIYSQQANRWSGVTGAVCPLSVPTYADCSSFVSWLYWVTFGNWPDYLNNQKKQTFEHFLCAMISWLPLESFSISPLFLFDFPQRINWNGGYTGTLFKQGIKVSTSNVKKGDVVLYGTPTASHAAIYVGNNQVVTFGSGTQGSVDPIRLRSLTYRTDFNGTYVYPDFWAIGTSCTQTSGKVGSCIDTDITTCSGTTESGKCDGPTEIKCCVSNSNNIVSSSLSNGNQNNNDKSNKDGNGSDQQSNSFALKISSTFILLFVLLIMF